MFGSVQFFPFVPSEKRRCTHMPCIIFTCTTFSCQREVAKTKIIIFGSGEPYQAISEFSSLYLMKNAICHRLRQIRPKKKLEPAGWVL